MSENLLLGVWVVKIITVVLCAVLYRLGGQYEKAIRRFVMPILYISACCGIAVWKSNFSWWIVLTLPMLICSLCLGYGADNFSGKIRKRFIYGLAISFSFLPFAILFNSWILYIFHTLLCIIGSIVFGVLNPFKEAVAEEAVLGLIYLLLPIMMI